MDESRKRKTAVLFAYNGLAFKGSQIQGDPEMRTVEKVLEQALFEIGCISEDNHNNLQKIK